MAIDEDGNGDRSGIFQRGIGDAEVSFELQALGGIEKETQLGALSGPSPGTGFHISGDVANNVGVGARLAQVDEGPYRARLGSGERLSLDRRGIGIRDVW